MFTSLNGDPRPWASMLPYGPDSARATQPMSKERLAEEVQAE